MYVHLTTVSIYMSFVLFVGSFSPKITHHIGHSLGQGVTRGVRQVNTPVVEMPTKTSDKMFAPNHYFIAILEDHGNPTEATNGNFRN